MKTLIATALIAAAGLAAPAAAQVAPGAAAALAHFNQSREVGDRTVLPAADNDYVTVSTRSARYAAIYDHFNRSAENRGDLIGQGANLTVASGSPAYGADILARIAAERQEDQ